MFRLFTPHLSVCFVFSWEESSLTESNQQICEFHKSVIFKIERHFGAVEYIFDISKLFIPCNAVLIYIYMGVSVYWLLCGCVPLSVLTLFEVNPFVLTEDRDLTYPDRKYI